MEIRILTSPGCPHGAGTLHNVQDVVNGLAPGTPIAHSSDAGPQTPGFRGSPTVLVDDVDLEDPDGPPPADGCRLYDSGRFGPGLKGVPPRWLAEAAILRALNPRHILFLCVANSARSQMAEGIGRALAPAGVRVSSAGSEPSRVRPQAIQALKEIGIDITDHSSKGIPEADDGTVDVVITLCAEEVCPVYLGQAHRVHWGLPDPAGAGATPQEEMDAFRQVRDELITRLSRLFGRSVA